MEVRLAKFMRRPVTPVFARILLRAMYVLLITFVAVLVSGWRESVESAGKCLKVRRGGGKGKRPTVEGIALMAEHEELLC